LVELRHSRHPGAGKAIKLLRKEGKILPVKLALNPNKMYKVTATQTGGEATFCGLGSQIDIEEMKTTRMLRHYLTPMIWIEPKVGHQSRLLLMTRKRMEEIAAELASDVDKLIADKFEKSILGK
jgi:hypothetical protein